MSDLISRSVLYDKIVELEDLARKRVLDTPTNSPCYMRYVCQLNERTNLKHMVADAPTIEAVPVVHGEWKYYKKQGIAVCTNCSFERNLDNNFGKAIACPNCGADM